MTEKHKPSANIDALRGRLEALGDGSGVDGEVLRLLSSIEDELAEARKQTDNISNLVPCLVYRLDPEGRITFINDAVRQYGYDPDELLGKPILDLVHPEFKEQAQYKIRERRTGQRRTRNLEIRMCRPRTSADPDQEKASYFRVAAEGLYLEKDLEKNKFLGTIGVAEDITRHLDAEKVRQQYIDELAALNRFGQEVAGSLLMDEVVRAAMDGLTTTMSPDLIVFYLWDGKDLRLLGERTGQGSVEHEALSIHKVGECLCGLAASEQAPVYSLDIHQDPRCTLTECKKAGYQSFASFPLLVGDALLGVLGLGMLQEYDFACRSEFLEALMGEVSIALNNALLYQKLEQMNEFLEARVNERTTELSRANQELASIIKAQEQTSDQLRRSERRFQLMAQHINDVFWMIEPDSPGAAFVSPAYEKIWRRPVEDLYKNRKQWYEAIHPEDLPIVESNFDQHKIGKSTFTHFRIIQPDGKIRWIEDRVFPVTDSEGNLEFITGLASDITERKKAEAALKESEQKYRLVVERANDGIAILQNGLIMFGNQRLSEMIGLTPDNLLGRSFFDFIHPSKTEEVRDRYHKRMRGETAPARYDSILVDRLGRSVHVEANAGLINYNGSPADLVYLRDITEAKKAEEALRASEKKHRQLYESMRDGYVVFDLEGRIVESNRFFQEMLGYDNLEIEQLTSKDLTPEKWREIEASILNKEVIARGYSQVYEMEYRRRDGATFPVSLRTYLIRGDDGEPAGMWSIARDITRQKEIENELREGQDVLRALIDSNPESLFLMEADGKILAANETVARRHGTIPGEMIGRNMFDMLPPDQAQKRRTMMKKVLTEARPVKFSDTRDDRSVEIHFEPILDPDGRVTKLAVFGQDVTERKQSEERKKLNQARLEALYKLTQLDAATDQEVTDFALEEAVRFTKSTGGYLHFLKDDQVSLELYTWSSGVRKHCRAVPHPHYPLAQAGVWADCVRLGKPILHNDYPALTGKRGLPEGHFPVIRHMSVPIFDEGKVVAVAGVGNKEDPYDETDVKQLYLFMDGMWKILRKKRINSELILAKEMAEYANTAKSEFLANMSHEIRTPITGVLGMLNLLQATKLNGEQKEYVEVAVNSSRGLLNVINDILDFSKIEAGKIELIIEPFDLEDLLKSVRGLFQNQAVQKGLNLYYTIDGNMPRRLIGDSGRLRQILFNLIGNAIKFTKVGEVRVEVRTLSADNDATSIKFTVSDTGVGVPQDKIENIFDSFTQIDGSYTREYQGTGLGLSIVKRLIELMGGRIEVKSQLGQGTSFTFNLTMKTARPSEKIHPEQTDHFLEKHSAPLNILVAEDNSVNRLLATRLLNKIGHKVVTAENGREALAKLAEARFDLIFMDVQMPFMDGVEATRRIRADQSGDFDPRIPIIAMTAHAMKGDRESFIEAGMDGYVAKPFQMEELYLAIAEAAKKGSPG